MSNSKKFYFKDNMVFVAPSNKKNKKYDVYDNQLNYITSFGAYGMPQYMDVIGHYSDMDTLNEDRKYLYYQRHKHDKNIYPYSSFFSNRYLWPN